MKIGVSSYSFTQYIGAGKLDNISVIKKAKEMGFSAIEYTALPGDVKEARLSMAEAIKQEAKNCGTELSAYVCGANLYADGQEAEVSRICDEIDIANTLGVKLFRYDVMFKMLPHISFGKALERVVPSMRKIADYGEKLGIKTMIENHGYAFQDHDRIERVYEAVNHENFGLLLDIGNFLCADEDPVICVSRLAHLACHVHLKDFVKKDFYDGGDTEHFFRTRAQNLLKGTYVGGGAAKTAQCLKILKEAGYDGYIDIEFEGPEDCISELEKGLRFCKNNI